MKRQRSQSREDKIPYPFIAIPDPVNDALWAYKIPGKQARVLHWVISQTIGRKHASGAPDPQESLTVSKRQAEGLMRGRMHESDIGKALKALTDAKVLVCQPGTGGRPSTYSLNLAVEQWDLPYDGPRPSSQLGGKNVPKLAETSGEKTSPSSADTLGEKTSPGVGGETSPSSGEKTSPSEGEKTAQNGAPSPPLEKKREEERRSPQTPQGVDGADLLAKKIFVKLSQAFYPMGGAPRVAQASIRDFVAAYRDHLADAAYAVQVAILEQQSDNEKARSTGRTPLHHPIKPILTAAAFKLQDAGIVRKPREQPA